MTTTVGIADRIADGTPNSPTPLFPCPLAPERHRPSMGNWRQARIATAAATPDRHAWMACCAGEGVA